jgi:hypothetical protein
MTELWNKKKVTNYNNQRTPIRTISVKKLRKEEEMWWKTSGTWYMCN